MTHYRDQDQEHPGVAACCIPDDEEGITRIVKDVDCPACLKLMKAWGVFPTKTGHGYDRTWWERNRQRHLPIY